MNNINIKYFSPIFRDYLSEIQPVKDCGYGQLPFIPYTFPKYESAPLKVFYIGRDTYYWCEYDASYKENPEAYIKDNASFVNVENIKKDWSKSGSFWGTVGKLHIQLMTGVYHHSINELTTMDWELLEEIGYGNLFSIERIETLKKKKYKPKGMSDERTEYDDINDIDGYKALCNLAKPFENLKTIISAYGEPDVVIILSWTDKKDFFEGLDDYECEKELYEEYYRSVFLSKTHKTKVVWSSHPNRFPYMSTNQEKMCQYLCDTVNILMNKQ